MPITRSAHKALRQSRRRASRNRARTRAYQAATRAVKRLATGGKTNETALSLPRAYRALDKAAKSNVIHKNKAARLKSRLARLVAPSAAQR